MLICRSRLRVDGDVGGFPQYLKRDLRDRLNDEDARVFMAIGPLLFEVARLNGGYSSR